MEQVCKVKSVPGNKVVDGVVMEFTPGRSITVVINKLMKIVMKFNGRVYEGRAAGLDFETAGPTSTPRDYQEYTR